MNQKPSMSHSKYNYFKEALEGESRWWSWLMVFWFTILGWLVAQIIVTGPIPAIAEAADPAISAEIKRASSAMQANIDSERVGLLSLIFVVTTVAGVLFWTLNRNNGKCGIFKDYRGKSSRLYAYAIGISGVSYGAIFRTKAYSQTQPSKPS